SRRTRPTATLFSTSTPTVTATWRPAPLRRPRNRARRLRCWSTTDGYSRCIEGMGMKRLLIIALGRICGTAHAQLVVRQSDAVEIIIGPIVDSADATVETGLTISQGDVTLIKCAAAGDCGASAQKNDSGACTHVASGRYECDLDTTDTNTVGMLHVSVN